MYADSDLQEFKQVLSWLEVRAGQVAGAVKDGLQVLPAPRQLHPGADAGLLSFLMRQV